MCVAAARVGMGERCALKFLQPICFLHSSWVVAHKTDHLIACAVSLFTWRGLILYPSSVSIILFCQALPRRQSFIDAAVQGRRNCCCICDHFENSHLSPFTFESNKCKPGLRTALLLQECNPAM